MKTLDDLAGGGDIVLTHQVSEAVAASQNALQNLRGMLENHRNYIERSTAVLAEIKSKGQLLDETSTYYRTLATNMRIRAASVPNGEENFGPMVLSTLKLAKAIGEKSEEINALADTVCRSGANTAKGLGDEIGRLDHILEHVDQQVRDSRSRLSSLQVASESDSKIIATQEEYLNSIFGELVVAIQFHDRIRQRVEHIQALTGLHEHSMPEIGNWIATINLAQLEDEAQLLSQLKRQAQSALEGMRSILDRRMSLDGVEQGHDVQGMLNSLEKNLLAARQEFNQSKLRTQDALEMSSRFRTVSTRIYSQLQIVMDWKVESKLLSLNAVLTSNQFGDAGAGLRVISKEIVGTSETLSEIVAELQVLASQIEQDNADEKIRDQVEDFFDKAIDGVNAIRQKLTEATDMQSEQTIKPLRIAMSEAFEAIKNLDTLANALDASLAEFDILQDHRLLPPGHDDLVDKTRSLYTMQAERIILDRHLDNIYLVTNSQPCTDSMEAEIELF